MKVTVKYEEILLRFQEAGHLKKLFKGNEDVYEKLIAKGVIIACRMANTKKDRCNIVVGFGGGCNHVYTIRVRKDDVWDTSIGDVDIDFKNGTFKVRMREWRWNEFLEYAYYNGVYYMKYVHEHELLDWKKQFNFVESEELRRVKAFGENMMPVTDRDEVFKLLLNKKFKMYNKANNHKGELTVLDKEDVDNILGDGPLIATDGKKTVVEYPFNLCKMESV